jgi:hypothetical protein
MGCSSVSTHREEKEENTSVDQIESDDKKEVITEEDSIEVAQLTNGLLFSVFYKKFCESIKKKNYKALNDFIHPNYGLYVIQLSGAVPLILQVYNIEDFKPINQNKKFLELDFRAIEEKPLFESLPKVICDVTIYDKLGCFAEEVNPLLVSQIWNYASLNEKEIQAIESLVETVEITVVNTSNYTFHFSIINEKWCVTFIDMRIHCTG